MLLVVTCWSLLIAVSLIWRQGMTSKTMDVLTRFVFYIPFFRVFTRLTCQALDQMQVAKCFLLHSSRANDELKFIVNRCDSFASYWQQFIQKKYYLILLSHTEKNHFIHPTISLTISPIASQSPYVTIVCIVVECLPGSGDRLWPKKKREMPPLLNIWKKIYEPFTWSMRISAWVLRLGRAEVFWDLVRSILLPNLRHVPDQPCKPPAPVLRVPGLHEFALPTLPHQLSCRCFSPALWICGNGQCN